MRVRRFILSIQPYISCHKNLGELPKGTGAARTLFVVDHVRVAPFFKLEDLPHLRWNAHAAFGGTRKHIISRHLCQIPTQLEDADAVRLGQVDPGSGEIFPLWNLNRALS